MAKTRKKLGLMLATLILILACATPNTPPPPGFVETAIAGTYSVAASQTAQVQVLQESSESVTPVNTRMASATPLPTFTLVFFGEPEVRALVNTSCRKGPGSIYEQVFLLRVGRLAGLVGKSADGFYLIIRNPDKPEQVCWVEALTVQINGFAVSLPVMTAPPTPRPTRTPTNTRRPAPTATLTPTITATPTTTETGTPTTVPPLIQFNLELSGPENCPTGSIPPWWINFLVGNTGDVDFESLSLTLTDTGTLIVYLLEADVFTDRNECGPEIIEDVLLVGGGSLIVSAPELDYDPAGHTFDASIMLCTEAAQAGTCITRMISFTP